LELKILFNTVIIIISIVVFGYIFYKSFNQKQVQVQVNNKITSIIIHKGDIIKLDVECIVNASNLSGLSCNIPNHCIDSAIHKGDITKLDVECIVNASNPSGLGCNIPNYCIDSTIHIAAGPELLKECINLGGIPTGVAKITKPIIYHQNI